MNEYKTTSTYVDKKGEYITPDDFYRMVMKLEQENADLRGRWDKLTGIVKEWSDSVTCPPDWEVFFGMQRVMKELEREVKG